MFRIKCYIIGSPYTNKSLAAPETCFWANSFRGRPHNRVVKVGRGHFAQPNWMVLSWICRARFTIPTCWKLICFYHDYYHDCYTLIGSSQFKWIVRYFICLTACVCKFLCPCGTKACRHTVILTCFSRLLQHSTTLISSFCFIIERRVVGLSYIRRIHYLSGPSLSLHFALIFTTLNTTSNTTTSNFRGTGPT